MPWCVGTRNLTIEGSPGIVGFVTEEKERPLGEWLKERREELDLSLEQVEEETRIRVRYLQALEAEDFDALPDPVVGRGFLRNYAAYLELDPQEVADRYSRQVAPPPPESRSVDEPTPFTEEPFRPMALHEMPAARPPRALALGLVAILIVALALLAWWSYPRLQGLLAQDQATATPMGMVTATQRAINTALATATHTPTPAPTATEATLTTEPSPTLELTLTPTYTPSPTPSPSPPVYTGVFLELVLTDTSWIQVTVDGVREFQGELEAESHRSWYGDQRIELRIGNAGAVIVTVNGQNLGTLGAVGEVVDRVFEKVGDDVTQATVTPEVTGTVTVEATAEATATLQVTATATGEATPIPETGTPTSEPTALPPTDTPTVEPTPVLSPTEPITPTATP